MTEATGSQSQQQQGNKSPAPWEQVWNTVTTTFNEATTATKSATDPAKGLPWERQWSSPTPPDKPRTVAPTQPPVDLTSGTWADINKKYAQSQPGREQDRLLVLQSELAKETNPKNIAILKRQIEQAVRGN